MLTAFLLLMASAEPGPVTGLAAITPWGLENKTACRLTRRFGEEKDPLIMNLSFLPMEPSKATLTLFLRRTDKLNEELKAEVTFNPASPVASFSFEKPELTFVNPAAKAIVAPPNFILAKIERSEAARLLQARSVTINGLTSKPIMLQIDGSPEVSAALDDCDRTLAKNWGIDQEHARKIDKPAQGIETNLFTMADYPRDALRAREEGDVTMVWEIGVDGAIRNCRIVQSSGSPSLDKTSCKLLSERNRYRSPAIDREGQPISSWGLRRVTWKLPQ